MRARLVQLLGGALPSLPKQIVTRMVLSSLGGWRGWGGFLGDLLRSCCGQGDVLRWNGGDWLPGARWWLLSRARWDLSILLWGGLSVGLEFGGLSGVAGDGVDPSRPASPGAGDAAGGAWVVDGLRERRQRWGRSRCRSRPRACCCWPCPRACRVCSPSVEGSRPRTPRPTVPPPAELTRSRGGPRP